MDLSQMAHVSQTSISAKLKPEVQSNEYSTDLDIIKTEFKQEPDEEFKIDLLTVKNENILEQEFKDHCKKIKNFQEARATVKVEMNELDTKLINCEIDLQAMKNDQFDAVAKINMEKWPYCPKSQKYNPASKSSRGHFLKRFKRGPILCPCGKFFAQAILFTIHYFVHFIKKRNKSSSSLSKQHQEPRSYNGVKYRVGSKQFSNKLSLAKDFRRRNENKLCKSKVSKPTRKRHQCKICLKLFSGNTSLTMHARVHTGEKPYKCDICSKQFAQKQSLISHSRTHTGEKPFKCETCLKLFTDKRNLQVHYRGHAGIKPFKCDICLKEFSQKHHLIYHSKNHTGEKPYKCEVCSKQFSNLSVLVRHCRIHTGEKTFNCEICLKQFERESSLIAHSRVHTGEKPFKCEICSKVFSQKQTVTTHNRIHTGIKPYKCEICLKEFSWKSSLTSHLKAHQKGVYF